MNHDYIIRDFLTSMPHLKPDVISWRRHDELSIIVEMRDGSVWSYDFLTKACRHAASERALKQEPIDEKEWRLMFARNLYRRLRIKGINQYDLSNYTGISPASITKYINGDATPTVYKLMHIANALDCSVEDLIYF